MSETKSAPTKKCEGCDGCGKIANDEDGTPWSAWTSLPLHSAAAVVAGIVKPITCPGCNGTGAVMAGEATSDINADLLAALEKIVNELQAWSVSGDSRPATWADRRIEIGRAALAKVKP
jgi:hypothetical protein